MNLPALRADTVGLIKTLTNRDLPGGPAGETPDFHCRFSGPGDTKTPHAAWCGQKKKS